MFVGLLDDTDGPIHQLVRESEVALPLHPEYGTEPNVFYVPPLSPHRLNDDLSINYRTPRIPPAYLEALFGPKVHAALDTLRCARIASVILVIHRPRGVPGSRPRSR